MGQQGTGGRNGNGTRFADLLQENGLVIGGTISQHKAIDKLTWISLDGKTSNQIDPHCHQPEMEEITVRCQSDHRGREVGSDHHLLLGKLHLQLRKTNGQTTEQLFDSQRLWNTEVKEHFTLAL